MALRLLLRGGGCAWHGACCWEEGAAHGAASPISIHAAAVIAAAIASIVTLSSRHHYTC